MTNYFTGTVELGKFNFELEKKIHVSGTISERWVQLLSRSLACGEDKKRTIERKIGISKTERDDFESLVKGSIGVKGIASVESQIKSKTGIEVTFERTTIETAETTFKAPECGRITFMVYQKVREYDINITYNRFFSKKPTRIVLTEYTDNIYDQSVRSENEPDCGCQHKSDVPDNGLLILLLNDNYQLITPYQLIGDKVNLKNLGLEVSVEDFGNLTLNRFSLPTSQLPKYVAFFAGINETATSVRLKIREENPSNQPFSNYWDTFPTIGEIYQGKVKSIMPFGAFVEIMPGTDGLLHISEIDHKRYEAIDGIFEIGDEIRVKLMDIDKEGRLKLSSKAILPNPEKSKA